MRFSKKINQSIYTMGYSKIKTPRNKERWTASITRSEWYSIQLLIGIEIFVDEYSKSF